ncbi:hypothetical protein [Candidatus Poriferisodalis sp.]|uniref:hypothetical protein n=1 Tax=Candidatus Poriferisodalis sp. TaxID=3101277 RepID=UPI003B02BF51
MAEDRSLLGHLLPKLTCGVEDAATDALAFILNRSEACRAALVDLVSQGDCRLASLTRATTQVSPTGKERLDLVAWDSAGSKRLIIESKFWAPLLSGQASGYVKHLADDGPAVLLFVAPERSAARRSGKRSVGSSRPHKEWNSVRFATSVRRKLPTLPTAASVSR